MLFYETMTTEQERTFYVQMLQMMGSLSNLFSESPKPFLVSRATENIFCRCLNAENLSRGDITADAKKGSVGIGIKTWVDSNSQKIAEFDSLKSQYQSDDDETMIRKIAQYRNDRIDFTMRLHNLNDLIYHYTVRDIGEIQIYECPLVPIDIEHIRNVKRKRNSISFDDRQNEYSFSISKSTLYKKFYPIEPLKIIPVSIIDDPYTFLAEKMGYITEIQHSIPPVKSNETLLETAILPLYSENGSKGKYVPPKNNLNMRFAGGRPRNVYEIGLPIPAEFRHTHQHFFPGRDISFRLMLPDGTYLSAKQCQEDGKSLMSNPNSDLGEWLINKVLKINPEEVITYEMLIKFGIDSVEIHKIYNNETKETYYKIDFALVGSYENYKVGWKN